MAGRVCRACGSSYDYPARGGLATRTHCEECATLDPPVRRTIEKLNQRIGRLTAEVERLKEKKIDRGYS